MIPSIKTLRRLADHDTARQLRMILEADNLQDLSVDPDCLSERAQQVLREQQLYGTFHDDEVKMELADSLLETHGVEALRCDGYHGSYHHEIHATYCNTGDTYADTLILESETGRFIVSSWGDYVETIERRPRSRGGCRFP